jgi:peptide/histidine transporter 3/4
MDDKLVWLLIPQVLYGFGYMLVFMTTLEFICAQAPYTLKGFMIGIWYCMFSIKYILVGNVDLYIYDKGEMTWIIYESIKTGMNGLSVMLFGISCRWYRYHERDEVVNVQGMIENIYERELLQQQDEDSDESLSIHTIPETYHTFN